MELEVPPMETASERIRLRIDGMHCDGCVRRVRKLLEMAGASEVHSVEIGSAELTVPPEVPTAAVFTEALENAGFQATIQQ